MRYPGENGGVFFFFHCLEVQQLLVNYVPSKNCKYLVVPDGFRLLVGQMKQFGDVTDDHFLLSFTFLTFYS